MPRGAGFPSRPRDGLADVVIDTTGSPAGLELAVRLARHEVHLKSTHGQQAARLAHLTELVVDELALAEWRGLESAPADVERPRIAWLVEEPPPAGLEERAELVVFADAAAALVVYGTHCATP